MPCAAQDADKDRALAAAVAEQQKASAAAAEASKAQGTLQARLQVTARTRNPALDRASWRLPKGGFLLRPYLFCPLLAGSRHLPRLFAYSVSYSLLP